VTIRVEQVRSRTRPGSVRHWSDDGELLAGTCRECGALTAVAELSSSRAHPGGRHLLCRPCNAARLAIYDDAHPEAKRARSRASRLARTAAGLTVADNRSTRDRRRRRAPAQLALDLTRLRPDGLKRCRLCREQLPIAAYGPDAAGPDGLRTECRPCDAAAKARRRIGAYVTSWEDRDLWTCAYCGAPFEEIEHVLALSAGGADVPENTVPSCEACNRGPGGKHDADLFEWRPDLLALALSWERV
jgi:5-methylcytosine-specific restriction endonuclease McrA